MEALEALRQAGKIRATGVSIHGPEEGLALLPRTGFPTDTLQLVYNLINIRMAKDVLPLALEEDVRVISRVPFQYGVLTGKFEKDTTFNEDDHRTWSLKPEIIERGNRLPRNALTSNETTRAQTSPIRAQVRSRAPEHFGHHSRRKYPRQVEENASVSDGQHLPPGLIRSVSEMQVSS